MKKQIYFIFFLSLFWSVSAHTVIIDDLYAVEISVAGRSADDRQQAIVAGMRMVLVKLTGDRRVPSRSGIANLIPQAEQYVQQFEYRQKLIDEERQLFLWIHFEPLALDQILRDASIPKWGQERPSTLVWLALQDKNQRRLLGTDDTAYIEYINNHAIYRGISLVFPLLDLQDSANLQISDIWGDFSSPVQDASKRYGTDSILTGRVELLNEGIWKAHWGAYIEGKQTRWQVQGKKIIKVLTAGIDGLADRLAIHYAQAGSHTRFSSIDIWVKNVRDFSAYTKVLRYLESLNSITRVTIKTVTSDGVLFSINTEAGADIVYRAIDIGEVLEINGVANNEYRLR